MRVPARGAFVCAAALLLAVSCAPRPSAFSTDNAYAHIRMLAGTIGSRPAGTDANRRARDYIVQALRSYGFRVRVQETDAARPLSGVTARVANIIAAVPGRSGDAIALVSHYDSVSDGPGAADDGFAVGACLEAARVLAARGRPNYALVVIVTDAEELGLMGAIAVVKDPIVGRLRAVLNFEAIGSASPDILFETAPGSGQLLEAWARGSPRPDGASFYDEIYKRLPNNTDFTLFRRARIPGLNFASIGDGYSYHTDRDTVERLDRAAVRRRGENIVGIVEAIDARAGLAAPTTLRTTLGRFGELGTTFYFDVLRAKAFVYGWQGAIVLLAAAVLAALFGWLTILPAARAGAGIGRMLLTAAWTVVGAAAAFGAMAGATWLLRETRETYHPWYAHANRFFVFLAVAGILAGWLVVRAGRLLPARMRGSTHPAVIWALALPLWLLLAIGAQLIVPAAAYLATVPLVAAGVALAVLPVRRAEGVRLASAIALAVGGALWLPSARLLLDLAVPVFGRLPIVTPVFVYPALLLVCGLTVVPAVLALIAGVQWRLSWRRGNLLHVVSWPEPGRLLPAATIVAAAWCWFAPAYSDDRPLHMQIRYVNDLSANRLWWEMGGNEPAIDVGADAPVAGAWERMATAGLGDLLVPPLRQPFAVRAGAAINQPPPLSATGSLDCRQQGCTVQIRAVPQTGGLIVVFTMPRGVTPEESNLPGTWRDGAFRAIYAAVPPEGMTFRARFDLAARDRLLDGATIVVMADGVPGAAWPKLPGWLPQQHIAWHAGSYYVIPVRFVPG